MKKLIRTSLLINIVVLMPIVLGMFLEFPFIDRAWGTLTASRGILTALYFALLVASIALLARPVVVFVVPVLALQVVYKLTTLFTVGLFNPIVISNLVIAVVHLITLWVIYQHRKELNLHVI